MIWAQVALGGALGAMARFGVGILASGWGGWPFGTLIVNILGCFIMGVTAVFLGSRGPDWTAFLLVGVLGGFTTFSAFSLDALRLWQQTGGLSALCYIGATMIGALAAVAAGAALAEGLFG